jgi:hypothetical protein
LICMVLVTLPYMSEDVQQALVVLDGLAFPILCSVFLAIFIRPDVFPLGPDQGPAGETSDDQIPEGGKND